MEAERWETGRRRESSNDNTRERGLEEDNIMIDDDDHEDVSFELPFDNIIPFP